MNMQMYWDNHLKYSMSSPMESMDKLFNPYYTITINVPLFKNSVYEVQGRSIRPHPYSLRGR